MKRELGSTLSGSSVVYQRRSVSQIRTYNWPPLQLNFWIFVMLLSSSSIVGVFSTFVQIQTQLELPIPWYERTKPFASRASSCAIAILFMGFLFWLIATRRLLPAIVMIGAFMLFVLWLVGLVIVSVQLWGPSGSIQSTCSLQVFSRNPQGLSQETLAWMQQRNICQSWHFVFAMALTGIIFLVWVMIMAYQVFANS
ncbi:hypothetical protein NOR_03207 [Metarhizium rileyi]|uniref:Arginase-like protein n=1 Tax=Metarhizium rileyi (strain RCEF 4871) TaxID=1649241 RepID=A0A162JK32_METRR|nr:hypothetical protein NOR_03207 [Metarhizium rileyi RCEF 4871]